MSVKTATGTIHELDTVELLVNLPDAPLFYPEAGDSPLHTGDRGMVISAHPGDESVTVEFFRDGETVAITDVRQEHVRLVSDVDTEPSAHLEFAFLADKARFLPNQRARFNVVGGGLWHATSPTRQSTHPNITVVIGVGYARHGLDIDHEVLVTFKHPDDPRIRVGPLTGGEWQPSRTTTHPVSDPQFEPESIVDVILVPYSNPHFSDWGRYEFHITIDGREIKTLYFTISRPKA
jgi:hypothetical protein